VIQIRIVQIDEIQDFRRQYLLGNRPASAAVFPGDTAETTFHLAGFVGSRIVSIASLFLENHPDFGEQPQYRLRQMATATIAQHSGYGKFVLQFGINVLRGCSAKLLWCHARQTAFGFYEKQGFHLHGDFFDLESVGPHKAMYLRL
jgi:hypothetical protein